jgi:hypothetical protein
VITSSCLSGVLSRVSLPSSVRIPRSQSINHLVKRVLQSLILMMFVFVRAGTQFLREPAQQLCWRSYARKSIKVALCVPASIISARSTNTRDKLWVRNSLVESVYLFRSRQCTFLAPHLEIRPAIRLV